MEDLDDLLDELDECEEDIDDLKNDQKDNIEPPELTVKPDTAAVDIVAEEETANNDNDFDNERLNAITEEFLNNHENDRQEVSEFLNKLKGRIDDDNEKRPNRIFYEAYTQALNIKSDMNKNFLALMNTLQKKAKNGGEGKDIEDLLKDINI